MQVYSGIYYVLYCPPDLILRIKPNIASFQAFDESSNTSSSVAALTPFDSLLRAVKPRVVLAPHVIKMHEQGQQHELEQEQQQQPEQELE